MRRLNAATGVAPFADVQVRDLGDCWIERPFALEGAHDEIGSFYKSIVAAGDPGQRRRRSFGHPADPAPVGAARPVGMIHIDAHCDTGDDYLGSRFTTARHSAARWKKVCWIRPG